MATITWDSINVGDELPVHKSPKVSRVVLALFAGGSGDHNPVHLDSDLCKAVGMEDVFAQGMLSMAYLAQLITHWVPQKQLRTYGVRFTSITPINVRVICTGKVIEKFEANGEKLARLEVEAKTDAGTVTLQGQAVVALA